MQGHSWVLLLSLWLVQFATFPATPPLARTPPETQPATESSDPRRASDNDDLWPIRASVEVPSSPAFSPPVSSALLPEPVTRTSRGTESTSTNGDTVTHTELLTTLTSGFTDSRPAQGEFPLLMPEPTHSFRERDAASQIPTWLTPGLPAFPTTPKGNPQARRQGLATGPPGTQGRLPKAGGSSAKDGEVKARVPSDDGVSQGSVLKTKTLTLPTESPGHVILGGDWPSAPGSPDSAHIPHCNGDISNTCNLSSTRSPALSEDNTYNQSHDPSPSPAPLLPLLLIPLHADWNSAMATWGVAWEVHILGVGSLFAVAALLSALGLLLLPMLLPSGGGYLALAHLLLLAAGTGRAFSHFYDAYGHLDKLPAANFLLLHQAPFPCLTGASAAVFLFLAQRSRMRLPGSSCLRPCSLAVVLLLHFGATLASLLVLQAFPRWPRLLLVSPGVFVGLMTFLSVVYLVFFCYAWADAKHVYHLSSTSPSRRGWGRAAVLAAFSALFLLACAGLQLYAVLHALALATPTAPPHALGPWPWWAFQLSCRLCEVGACITLALAAAPHLHRSPRSYRCWPSVLRGCGFRGNASAKPATPPIANEWELRRLEKLAICEGAGSERLPLYALVDPDPSSLEGLDLLYHGTGVLSPSDSTSDAPLKERARSKSSSYASLQLDSDSTVDLRPPSPINLRRSIDEALFSPALFPHSLFSPALPLGSASLSPLPRESSTDHALYRTSSCRETEAGCPPIGSSLAGHAQWVERRRGSSSSSSLSRHSLDDSCVVLCPSNEAFGHCQITPSNSSQHSSNQETQLHGCYTGLVSTSQENLDQLAETDRAVQEEFIRVCRQIDALSISSDTIDL